MLTIRTKIVTAYTITFGCMLCLFAYLVYRSTQETELQKIDAQLYEYAAAITTNLETEENEASMAANERLALQHQISRLPGLHARFINQDGDVLFEDSITARHPVTGWENVLNGAQRRDIIHANKNDDGTYRCLWIPIDISDRYRAVAELTLSMSDAEDRLQHLQFLLLAGIPFALVIAALAAYAITRHAFRPIRAMIETAGCMTEKNLDQRLTVSPVRDEVRLLGETLNGMIERIESAFKSQKQLIADASHDIRTPLTVVCSELEFAAKHTTEPDVKESIQISLAEIDRLARLTQELMLLAKLDASQVALDRHPVRLDELLVDCVHLVDVSARKKNIQITVRLHDPVVVGADPEKMKSVILNLLDNAIKYSPNNTIINASIDGSQNQHAHRCCLTIEDQGPGIPPSDLTNIFKRFYRVESARSDKSGFGLGLSIARQLAELHGGTITAESELGTGSRFIVELPVSVEM